MYSMKGTCQFEKKSICNFTETTILLNSWALNMSKLNDVRKKWVDKYKQRLHP